MLSIIGQNDKVLYTLQWRPECNLNTQFAMQSSLDKFDLTFWKNSGYFMGRLDDETKGQFTIFGYATSRHTKFLLYFEAKDDKGKKEEKIKQFFHELHRFFAHVMMNPLYSINDQIKSPQFDSKVQNLVREYLSV